MKKLIIPNFKLKFLKSEPILTKSALGRVSFSLSEPKPVPDQLTLDLIKNSPKLILCGILPSRNWMQDEKSMKNQFHKISCIIPETKMRLTVTGFNKEDDKKVILLDLTPKKNLRKEYFENIKNSFYEELIMQMIMNECTLASFVLK